MPNDLVAAMKDMAADKGVMPSQLAIAWVVSKGIVPIPGTKRPRYVEENIAAASNQLSAEEVARLEPIVPLGTVTGTNTTLQAWLWWVNKPTTLLLPQEKIS